MKTELRALTGARGLAAWYVVLYHLRESMSVPNGVLAVLSKGYLAVDFFFLLSGFVIWATYVDRIRTERWRAVPTFLLRRIARIWPLHVAMLTFAVLIAAALHVTGRPADPRFPLAELPLHILLVQNWPFIALPFGINALDWNDPAWSISSEMFAYLTFPLIVLAIDWRRLPTPLLIAAILGIVAFLDYVMTSRGAHRLGEAIPYFGLLRCVAEFGCGTVLGALWLRFRQRPRWPAIMSLSVAAAGFLAFAKDFVGEIASVPIALAGLLLLLALTSGRSRNLLAERLPHYLGEISFATYLSHSLLWKAFKLALVHDANAVPPLLVILYLAVVLVASIALYHLLERPAQHWINQMAPRKRSHAVHGSR